MLNKLLDGIVYIVFDNPVWIGNIMLGMLATGLTLYLVR